MCYGDIDHGKDGYYREEVEREEQSRRVSEMTTHLLRIELASLVEDLVMMRDLERGGSPSEYIVERMDEIETELFLRGERP